MTTECAQLLLVCDSWKERIGKKAAYLQSILERIQVFEELHKFGDIGLFDKSFIDDLDWLHEVWLNDSECSIDVYEEIDERRSEIENKLQCLPFEKAWCYREPEFHTKPSIDILKNVFNEDVSWRFHPSIVKHMPLEDRERIFNCFEYMCYFVINVRDELRFDIESSVDK